MLEFSCNKQTSVIDYFLHVILLLFVLARSMNFNGTCNAIQSMPKKVVEMRYLNSGDAFFNIS